MPSQFASGKHALGLCDVCGHQYKLRTLRKLVVKTKATNILACPECWTPDQPQLQVGMRPVVDPQALRNPRPDNSYISSGLNINDNPGEGSRAIFWGWDPIGMHDPLGLFTTTDTLLGTCQVGTVTVQTTEN